jgi:polysaccharide biosynthesis protein PslJ
LAWTTSSAGSQGRKVKLPRSADGPPLRDLTQTDIRAPALGGGRRDAVWLLTIYLVLLMGIPSRLILAPLGGLGAPATVLSVLIFGWYLLCWFYPSSILDRGQQPIRVAAILWFCAIIASYVAANLHTMPQLAINGADRGIIIAAGWIGVLLLVSDGIHSLERLRTLLRRVVFGATAMAGLGMIQFFTGLDAAKYIVIPGLSTQQPYTDLLGRGDFNRPSSTAIHPIEFGVVLSLCLPIAIHQARYAPPGKRARRWIQVAIIAATLPMTVSRSAILGLVVGGAVVISTWPRRDRHYAYMIIVAGTVVMRALIPGLIGTITGLFLSIGSDSSAQERTNAFGLASPFISQHPWFGQGFGTFQPQIYFFTDDQYLGSLIETGIVGVLALITLFVVGWTITRRARKAVVDDELRHLAQCLAAPIAVALVSYATFDAFAFPMAAGLTFLLAGCAGAAWRLIPASATPAPVPDSIPARAQPVVS